MDFTINTKDEAIISLVHFLVTEENYMPISVKGIQDEIWLENLNAKYKIIRINSNYIHNDEQFRCDIAKLQFIVKQIKRKTLSLRMDALNICLDVNEMVDLEKNNPSSIETVLVNEGIKSIRECSILNEIFPNLVNIDLKETNNINNIIKVTEDINNKTQRDNTKFEDIFKPKKIIVTKVLIIINVFVYLLDFILNGSLVSMGEVSRYPVLNGEVYRLFTCMFLHGGLIHLLVNMYSLYIVGTEVENYFGKLKFIIIYLLSGILGSFFSIVFNEYSYSLGASGAIFGLMGCLLYFGYHYRLYLSNALRREIIPIITLNLMIGFLSTGIDNSAHIGGLIGGYLATMIVGLKHNEEKREQINGIIVYTLLIVFLIYTLTNLI